ncbi:MAG: YhbY family RNA-binding protein [Clostridia bacterium]
MIDKKQRIKLRSIGSTLKSVVNVGKDGFSDEVINAISEALYTHELVKVSLMQSLNLPSNDELCAIATKLNADVVATIGKKILFYRYSDKKNIKHVL